MRSGAGRGQRRRGRPCSTTANISAGGEGHPRRADRARVAEHASDVNDDEEDEVGVLRDAGGGAAARNEAAAAVAKSLSSTCLLKSEDPLQDPL